MTLDVDSIKRRRTIMMVVNSVAVIAAALAAAGYFKFALDWALFAFIGALAIGFGAQVWFIVGLRGPGKGA